MRKKGVLKSSALFFGDRMHWLVRTDIDLLLKEIDIRIKFCVFLGYRLSCSAIAIDFSSYPRHVCAMQTLIELLEKTTAFFAKKGVEHARLNAELLFAHVLRCKRLDLYLQFERPIAEATLDALRPLVKRRGQREPLQYIVGNAPFGELTLKVDKRVLIPRPETEEFVEHLLRMGAADAEPATILDLGTGSGAIALALAQRFAAAQVTALDVSDEALAVARENAALNGLNGRVTWLQADWFVDLAQQFTWIVANPPYLTEREWAAAAPEVKDYEPKGALVAADEGMADLMAILTAATKHLHPGGCVALETGLAHHRELAKQAEELGYASYRSLQDIHGHDRFFMAWAA